MLCVAGCYCRDIAANLQRQNRGQFALCVSRHLNRIMCVKALSALTYTTQICHDFDITNSLQYCDDNTLPHIAHFCSKIQEKLCAKVEK